MSEQPYQRKLTTIFYADVVDYSRLTGQDETGTHRRVMATLDFVTESIKSGAGTVLRFAGDAILAEFPSVVAALNAATCVQIELSARNQSIPDTDKVQIRIGLNIGEVLQDRDEIFGDGVNLAARLEAAAPSGGICISSTVHDQVAGKVDICFTDGGVEVFKNIAKPIHVYRWAPGNSSIPRSTHSNRNTLPSIFIETFSCLPDDGQNLAFTGALHDQILLRLSHRTGVQVVEASAERNIKVVSSSDYLIRGRINQLSTRCRANLSMIWAATGETVWAEGFSGDLDDPFSLVDEITDAVDSALRLQINAFDARRLADREETGLDHSELLTKAAECFYRVSMHDWRHAVSLIDRALAIRHDSPMALSMRVEGGVFLAAIMPDDLHDEDNDLLSGMADRAIALNNQSDYAFAIRGYLRLFRLNDFKGALEDGKQAITLSPSYAPGFEVMGLAQLCLEQVGQALEVLERAVFLSKKDPFWAYRMGWLALARFLHGDFDNALKDIDSALQLHPGVWTFHHLKGAILTRQGNQTAKKWLTQAAQLANVPHPFTVKLPLPDSYRRLLDARPGSEQQYQPKLFVV